MLLIGAGTAESADTDAPFEYALMADELISFTQALDLPPFHIVGYSDGANLGLHMANRLPDKVKEPHCHIGQLSWRVGDVARLAGNG